MTEYSVDEEIAAFFRQTTATRAECDERALVLAGAAAAVPVKIPGVCNYTVYAGGTSSSSSSSGLGRLSCRPRR